MTRVLVTGATGFVGSHLARMLLQQPGSEVCITAREASDFWRIADLKEKFYNIFYVDLAERARVYNVIKEVRPAVVYHLSTYGGFPEQMDKDTMIKANLAATMNLLDACLEHGVEQFINTGSSSEYGIKNMPMNENDVCEPITLYGITKLAATNYCSMIGKNNGYKVCSLRLFSPYGSDESPSRLYPTIVKALREGRAPRLSRPDSVRDFIEVEKVVSIYLAVTEANYEPGEIINVGSGKQKTVRQFFDQIRRELDSDVEPIWGEVPPRIHEPFMWEADVRKLRHLLNIGNHEILRAVSEEHNDNE